SFGKTVDDLSKPELIANAIWIAAPIPLRTNEHEEAQTLYDLLKFSDDELPLEITGKIILTQLDKNLIHESDGSVIRKAIVNRIQQCKYINANYQHVDGTSFAAPIVTSVIAQLLEAKPNLTPLQIREILFSTAKRLSNFHVERQGFGAVQPRDALLKVLHHEV